MNTTFHRLSRARLIGTCLCALLASPPVAADSGGIRFTDITASSGVNFTMTCGQTPSQEILEVNGGGVAMFDYDNDGDLDLFFANGATMADPAQGPGSRLYANNGSGTFRDVTRQAGIDLKRWAMGAAAGDYDQDGYDDLYVTCYGANVLLKNTPGPAGGRRFVDATREADVGDTRWGTSAAFGDLDKDGDLDLYVANYLQFDVANPPDRTGINFKGIPVMAGPAGLVAHSDVLYENLSNGRFRDITRESGCLPARACYGLSVVILDFDHDGHQDIFVGNDSNENFLFKSLGNRKFQNIGVISGIAYSYDGGAQATMGIAVADVDGNGYADVFTTNFSSDTNTLHLNLGDGIFDDRTSQFGLAMVSRPFLSWGTGFYDFDSDGDEDLFVASGHVYPSADEHHLDAGYKQPALLFERQGARFTRNVDAGTMFKTRYSGRSAAFGDLDNDGDVDVVMTTLNGPVQLFQNVSAQGNVVVVELEGGRGNHRALGSVVELTCENRVQRRWIHSGGYQTSNPPIAYFGLDGLRPGLKPSVRVKWPNGQTDQHSAVPLNQRITIAEGATTFRTSPLTGRSTDQKLAPEAD